MTTDRSSEREQLRSAVRQFLTEQAPLASLRPGIEDRTFDPTAWERETRELGLAGLAVPEEAHGAGGGIGELAVVCEEMGKVLHNTPFFATGVMSALVLTAVVEGATAAELLTRVASGDVVVATALGETGGSWAPDALGAEAIQVGDLVTVTGAKSYVLDAAGADVLLVAARLGAGVALLKVDPSDPGVSITETACIDRTRRFAEVELLQVPAQLLSDDAESALTAAHRRIRIALAAEQLGGAQECLDSAVSYATLRVQFGRPIGSFQAIKHKCADMLLKLESARSALEYAVRAVESHADDAEMAATIATITCSEAFTLLSKENLQIHGGIGYTWEHDSHLFLKRAKVSELFVGPAATHRVRLAALMGIAA